jgi:DNA anti-recombination protein RmuC
LQVIILGLKGLHIEKTARDILGHLGRLQGDLRDFQEDYTTLGGHIRHAAQKYDDAERKLARLDEKLRVVGETPIEKLPEGDTETRDESE